MAVKIETIQKRLDQKNAAIEKRLATTKKHAARWLKRRKQMEANGEQMGYEPAASDLESSCKALRYLLLEKKDLERELAKAIANKPIIPQVLLDYQTHLEKSFIGSRIAHRECLKGIAVKKEEIYRSINFDFNQERIIRKYAKWNYRLNCVSLIEQPVTDEENRLVDAYVDKEEAWHWLENTSETRHETDEHIAHRSHNDAVDLVEDLYNRTKIYTGEATSYLGLRVDQDNRGYAIINGIVNGERGACKVESISAGGYNIQCWHIRVLVKPVK